MPETPGAGGHGQGGDVAVPGEVVGVVDAGCGGGVGHVCGGLVGGGFEFSEDWGMGVSTVTTVYMGS